MRDQLARGAASIREAEAENDVVEPGLEQLQQGFAGDAALAQGSLERSGGIAFPSGRIG